jgi:hypothetical protein
VAFELIVGPANAGKVAELFRRYRACLERGEEALLVVPNGAAVRRAERELLAHGPLLGGAVTTFDGVFRRVVDRAGTRRPLLAPARRRLELSRLVASASLDTIGASAEGARFADALGRLLDRLGSGLVEPARFGAAAAGDAAAGDLARLAIAWDARLDELGVWDPPRQRLEACTALERSLAAWDGTRLFVQGFEDLTHAQETLVRRIAERAGAVMSLPYEPGRPAFAALRTTVARLAEHATIEERPPLPSVRPPRLARLERTLFDDGVGPAADGATLGPGEVVALEAAGARAEAELVLAAVCTALRAGTPPARIAIVTPRDPGAYGELLTALERGGVPFVAARSTTVARTPFGFVLERLLAFAWDAAPERRDLMAFLRSPWSGLPRRRVDFLEGRLRGRAIAVSDAVYAATVEVLGRPVDAVEGLRGPGEPARLVAETVRRLVTAAHGLGARPVAAEARPELAAARAALDALQALDGLEPRASRDEVRQAVLRARVDERRDDDGRVAVLDLRGARGIDVDVAVVLGLEQGGHGGRGDDAFLADDVREALGPPLASAEPGDLDRHLLYVALTRATSRVVVGRRVSSEDGRPLEPSPLWGEVERAAGGFEDVRRRGLADVAFTVDEAPTARERVRAVVHLARTDERRATRIADLDGTTRRLRRAQGAWRRETRIRDPKVLERLAALDRFPVTSLEKIGDCSSWWFLERYLTPREIDAAYDARLAGSIAHTALQRFYKQVPAAFGKDRLEAADADGAEALIRELVDEAMRGQSLPSDTLPARIVARRVARDLVRFVRHEAMTPSPLAATRLEVGFGGASSAPGLKEGLRIGDFAVSGKIDRIDTDPSFSVHALVQDYKTGKTAWGAKALIPSGKLQIPLYVLAARELLGMEPIGGLYRAVGAGGETRGVVAREAAEVLPPGLVRTDLVDHDELWAIVDEARQLAITHVARVRTGDIRHDPRDGTCPSYCPWGEACRISR